MIDDDALTVLLPVDPPKLSPGAARILLEIVLEAVEDFDGKSASTIRITSTPLGQEVAER
jgi:hypothetical protein